MAGGVELKGLRVLRELNVGLQNSQKDVSLRDDLLSLSVKDIVSGKYQPRTEFNDESLDELASSIKSQGIIQPIIVRKIDEEKYEIIAGERRWRAAIMAGILKVPAIVKNISDNTALAFSLIENIQREDLNPIDEAMALIRLKDEFLMTHEEIAKAIGRSRSSVTNLIRLLTLNSEVKNILKQGRLEMGHARALIALTDEQQLLVAHQIVDKGLSVRETEKLIRKIKTSFTNTVTEDVSLTIKLQEWNNILSKRLHSKVNVHVNKKGEGTIIIRTCSLREIEWLIDHINVN